MRSIITHKIEIIELGYATSVRAFGPDKKQQFLERTGVEVKAKNQEAITPTHTTIPRSHRLYLSSGTRATPVQKAADC
jgi:hypothetical protein